MRVNMTYQEAIKHAKSFYINQEVNVKYRHVMYDINGIDQVVEYDGIGVVRGRLYESDMLMVSLEDWTEPMVVIPASCLTPLDLDNKPKCECGADKARSTQHSDWCPKHG